ncbi:MAG: leucine--tRNA ligase [Vicingus serpentipes]|nr:leucine--tRNA ligase [Vicingus serpentipes]
MQYQFNEIEKNWQKYWEENKTFRAEDNSVKPKYYVLDMFPYPSGAGLHVGHPLGYIASDVFARYKRLQGFNVLHPMGYDSFGLPAEQYAIQTGQHPATTTKTNIEGGVDKEGNVIPGYRNQMDKIGFSFDWDREVRTSDPKYYKWTQWIFKQIFNSWYNKASDKAEKIDDLIATFKAEGNRNVNAVTDYEDIFSAEDWNSWSEEEQRKVLMSYRLTFLSDTWVNWCPALGTVLANDEIKDGVSERGGHPVEQKLMRQWSMRITAYAERLLSGLDGLDWTDSIKDIQRNWIGKSEGASVTFKVLSPTLSKGEGDTSPKYLTGDPAISHLLLEKAKEMRANPTPAESALWQQLKGKKLDAKFRQQHPVDTFIPDFVCLDKMLIVEVDGDIHDIQQEQDQERTHRLNELGFEVLRFRNEEVLADIDTVVNKIVAVLAQRSSIKDGDKVLPSGKDLGWEIEVFTTRPDTIFGVSFMVLAPEHELVDKITTTEQKEKIEAYKKAASLKSERDRMSDVKTISGEFTGAYALHPFTGDKVPVWIGDYVLATYGTGAVMAVPCGDQRDWDFAKHFDIPILNIFKDQDISEAAYAEKDAIIANSDFLNDLPAKKAIKAAIYEIEQRGFGKGKTQYKLRDAVFSRQRYWGEPFPVYYKGEIPYLLESDEVVELPPVDKYLPTEDGEPPLARANKEDWNVDCPGDRMEYNTMPGWAGSSWYFLRYMDPTNDNEFVAKDKVDYWKNVDLYIGGAEHATGHLLYSRFWTKFLYDLGYIPFEEPFQKMINQGMIQGNSALIYKLFVKCNVTYSKFDENNIGCDTGFGSLSTKQDFFISVNKLKEIKESKANLLDLIPLDVKEELKERTWNNASHQKNNFGLKKNIGSPLDLSYFNFELSGDLVSGNIDIKYLNGDKLNIEDAAKNSLFHYLNLGIFIMDDGSLFSLRDSSPANKTGNFIVGREIDKMSKSKYNVQTPDELVAKYGADTLRCYEMFLGPLEQHKPWDTQGITGVHGFLKKLWRLFHDDNGFNVFDEEPTKEELKSLHKTIKKIKEDIERFSFNTPVSAFMICVNELTALKCNKRAILSDLCIILSPYAPHIAEELWKKLGNTESISNAVFPKHNEEYLTESNHKYPVSFNGKMRFMLELPVEMGKEDIEKEVLANEQTAKYLDGKSPKKVIVVPKKIVNVVV